MALNKEGDNFATQVNVDLYKFRNGNSSISTNNTESLGRVGQADSVNTSIRNSSKKNSSLKNIISE